MTQNIPLPGRRVSADETFYTDWVSRGGDCILLRVQVLYLYTSNPGSNAIAVSLETRGEDGTTVSSMTATAGAIGASATGIYTAVYLAGQTTGGAKEQVRAIVAATGEDGDYFVVRIFPLIFFDSAKVA